MFGLVEMLVFPGHPHPRAAVCVERAFCGGSDRAFRRPQTGLLAANWGRKYPLWFFQLGLACCAIEMMAASGPRYDFMRFGIIPLPASPRQAD